MATAQKAYETLARREFAAGPRLLWMSAGGGLPLLALLAPTLLVPAFFMLVVLALLTGHFAGSRPVVPWPLAFLTLAFITWGASSALWALDPVLSLNRAARLALVTAAGVLLIGAARAVEARHRRVVAWSLLAGFALALSVAIGELFALGAIDLGAGGGGLRITPLAATELKRGLSIIFVFIWVLAAGMAALGRRLFACLCLAIPPGVMLLLESEASVVAWACGIAGLAAGALLSRRALLALTPLAVLYAVLVPFLARAIPGDLTAWGGLPFSALHRLAAWRFTAERVFERPLSGWGLENARVMPGGREPAGIAEFVANRPPDGRDLSAIVEWLQLNPPQLLPMHPHNFMLQVWLELGVPGVALAAAVLVVVLFALLRADQTRWQRGMGLGLFLATATLASLSYGAWQTWWHATFWILAAFMVIFRGRPEPTCGGRPAA